MWFSVSNAFEKSITIAPAFLLLFNIERYVSIIYRWAWWVSWFLQRPAKYIESLGSIKEFIWVYINFPNILEKLERVYLSATCMFLWTSVFVRHTRYTSSLRVSTKRYWISFETTAYCKIIELHFFSKSQTRIHILLWKLLRLHTLWFWVLNKINLC